MPTLNLRGLDEETAARLKEAARQRGVSVSRHALEILRRGVGLAPRSRTDRHHDLDPLAGTWTSADAEGFERSLSAFEQVDGDLWRCNGSCSRRTRTPHSSAASRAPSTSSRWPIPTNDLWVAATALEHGYGLFTYDSHFQFINGLLMGSRPEDFLP